MRSHPFTVSGAGRRFRAAGVRLTATSQFSTSSFRMCVTGREPKYGRMTCSRTCTARACVEGFIPLAILRSSQDLT
jgi:hypothetical protein